MKVKLRLFVALVYMLVFLSSAYSFFSYSLPELQVWRSPALFWSHVELLFLGFCGVLIAYWVYTDEKEAEFISDLVYREVKPLRDEIDELKRRAKALKLPEV